MTACATGTYVVGSDSWAPATYAVGKDPVQVAQANANRRGVLIVNDASSAGPVHVTDRSQASLSVGGRSYPLAVGEGITINTTAEVWVLNDDRTGATAVTVKTVEEFGQAAS